MDEEKARAKQQTLVERLKGYDTLLVAYSGGVDSTFLLSVAHRVLGNRVVAATANSKTFPERERDEAQQFTSNKGIRHVVFKSNEFDSSDFISNPPDRCYHCKKQLGQYLLRIASEMGIANIAHAINIDDLGDYRPGITAANELGIIAPLVDAELAKEEIRFLSKEMGLDTWDKPAMACLASRIPYGSPISEEKLGMIDEGEEFLFKNGFRQVRVRHHGSVARIELAESDLSVIMEEEMRKKVVEKFKQIGFTHISLDLEGYVSGSMNRDL